MDLNKAMLIGRLTRDPETRSTASGQSVTSFGLATNRIFNDANGQKQERVEYHNVVAWGRLAEICGQYLAKGRKIFIEGRLQTRDWEGQDGVKRFRTEIVADNMIMLDKSPGASLSDESAVPAASKIAPAPPADAPSYKDEKDESAEPKGDEEIKVENIPF